jgi:hypothetical protein
MIVWSLLMECVMEKSTSWFTVMELGGVGANLKGMKSTNLLLTSLVPCMLGSALRNTCQGLHCASKPCTLCTLQRRFELCIPRNQAAGPCSQFPYSYICVWAIYILPGSVQLFFFSQTGRPIVGIYKSLGFRSGHIFFSFSVQYFCSAVVNVHVWCCAWCCADIRHCTA